MLLPLAITVLIATVLCETAARKKWLPYWVTRKILHFVAVGACAVATVELERELFIWIVAGAEVILLGLILSNQLLREESGRRAWGIVWFPLALLILLLWVQDDRLIAFCMLILAVCDPAATIAGKLWAKKDYQLTGDPKSLVGSLAFLTSFGLLVWLHLPFGAWLGWGNLLALGLMLTAAEALGSRGLDNLIIPLFAAWFFVGMEEIFPAQNYALYLVIAALPFCWVLVRRRSLTPGGALTASLLGIVVVIGSKTTLWLLPLFLFLLSSSLIGRLFPVTTVAGDAKQKQPRDATQVLANGAVYGYLAAFEWPKDGFLYLIHPETEIWLLAAMAIATADTWSSEIGQYFRQPTYDLVKWRKVPAGLSGGVSIAGTLAGLGGATFLAGACFWMVPYMSFAMVIKIILIGFFGMLLDSALGSLFQAKYKDVATGAMSDTPGDGRELVGGTKWMTNDLVNFLAILLVIWVIMHSFRLT
ncbi:DUF92 domain-containing protein [Neolewinella aurantiaca]|uniref:DUF92 domain-containing protein n=1 Tax=Neolewinella aurantiaca TaxID=2602767 RepID=A0A5C7FUN8_9BACT|nr:DUF92 domain-containing protein [Neolewinella aurantiaca]TXF89165.1 DUF92 domain-containing protein [Neolewinella aurantiaca]